MSLDRGIELFNSGRFWEAHEAWEEVWMPDRGGPDSGFYKGLIQVAAGCLHYTRHNRRGTVNKWTSGTGYLLPYLPDHQGVDLASLVSTIHSHLAELAAHPHDWPALDMPQIERWAPPSSPARAGQPETPAQSSG